MGEIQSANAKYGKTHFFETPCFFPLSPSLWPEWKNTQPNFEETPKLALRNASFLPPLNVKISLENQQDNNCGDLLGGEYRLNVSIVNTAGYPFYQKVGDLSKYLLTTPMTDTNFFIWCISKSLIDTSDCLPLYRSLGPRLSPLL